MRRLAPFLLIAVAFGASAAEIWRWRDANGVVHYSDQPAPGAERVSVSPPPPSSSPPPATLSAPTAGRAAPPAPVRYTRCTVARPANDEVFFAVQTVNASLDIEPSLQPGHRITVYLNGAVYPDWPSGLTNYTFQNMYRGSYVLSVRILDTEGKAACTGPPSNFHVRQPSVLSPQSPVGRGRGG